ncbi:hypothetical protein ASF88_19930 [Leifsonia sp. Leaf336]|uniref:hypothetical protein n=1 Tax=Leifsonia sp. Leaf336 TaxID=1736341 RepID=UPI0006FD7467|nr:hypothetical protein [Leifsonia sp. Leaf336]KQR50493.1 hypothetical protein ASF88_19930 [Leifsonia sp. Leaf336]
MNIDWSRDFDRQLDRLEADKSERGQQVYRLLVLMLRRLRELDAAPVEETAMLKRVRQSRQYPVWRVSHPYREGIALRLICWFPPDQDRVVVALFAGEKASMGDVFYDSVGTRADQIIERWLEDTEEES